MARIMAYGYALIFALLINPFQSWLGLVFGWWLDSWERLYSDLAAGVLFGYASLIAIEILIRTQLFSEPLRKARPQVVGLINITSFLIGITGILLAGFLWVLERPFEEIRPDAYWVGVCYCLIALALLIYSVNLEATSKHVTDEALQGRAE